MLSHAEPNGESGGGGFGGDGFGGDQGVGGAAAGGFGGMGAPVVGGMGAGGEQSPLVVTSLGCGDEHTCVAMSDGSIRCWGGGIFGQLFNPNQSNHKEPFDPKISIPDVISVSAGSSHTCVLSAQGKVYCIGDNAFGQLGVDNDNNAALNSVIDLVGVTKVASKSSTNCALTNNQTEVYCWGRSNTLQLGGNLSGSSAMPVKIDVPLGGASSFVSLTVGELHVCVGRSDGAVYCWGGNPWGQHGDGGTAGADAVPKASLFPPSVEVAAGGEFTCARTATGLLNCVGRNNDGQLSNGASDPDAHPTPLQLSKAQIAKVFAGGAHACVTLTNGKVSCWGRNDHGQAGVPGDVVPLATDVPSLDGVDELCGGVRHTCALLLDGSVRCWGANIVGQLGDCSEVSSQTPVAPCSL